MKKSLILGGAAVLLIGGAAAALGLAKNSRTQRIQAVLSGTAVSGPEKEWLDMDGNGTVSKSDLYRAKLDAALHPAADEVTYVETFMPKKLGRTAYHEDTGTLWCSLSGSGVEFYAAGKRCTLTLTADAAYSGGDAVAARYAVYVDDTLVEDAQLLEETKEVAFDISPDGCTVKLIKLSESAQSSMGISGIRIEYAKKAAARMENPEMIAANARYQDRFIEFIGDSITCGYGVDGVYGKDVFKTANENVTKAYGYLAAAALNADYSMVSYSGHGILSGYTSQGKLNQSQLVPKYYGQVGHCSALVEGKHKIQDDLWDFSRQPDLIVINLGTNDASYTGGDAKLQKEFAAAYTEFLKKVREKNPDAPILCTLGIMGQTLCDAIDLAVTGYSEETGDNNINTMRFEMQQEADGYGVDWHPSAVTHQKAADQLTAFVRQWLGWQ